MKHGDSVATGDRRLYRLYNKIKSRCYNRNQNGYDRYGGRGILICDEWVNDFVAFKHWSYANGYKTNLSIDRIDNNLGYSPNNCRWVEPIEQYSNMRSSVKFGNEYATSASRKLGGTKNLVNNRLRLGWDKQTAFQTPARPKVSDETIIEIMSLLANGWKQREIAMIYGIKQSTISKIKTRVCTKD